MASSTSYRSVILAPVDDTSIPKHLVEIINDAVRLTLDRLTIILVSDLFDLGNSSVSRTQTWSEVQTMLTFVYIQASKAAQALDKILLEIDVLLKGVEGTLPSDLADSVDVLYEVHATGEQCLDRIKLPCPMSRRYGTGACQTRTIKSHPTGYQHSNKSGFACPKIFGRFTRRSIIVSGYSSRGNFRPPSLRTQSVPQHGCMDRERKGHSRRYAYVHLPSQLPRAYLTFVRRRQASREQKAQGSTRGPRDAKIQSRVLPFAVPP